MKILLRLTLGLLALTLPVRAANPAHIGYAYPAGGAPGTSFSMMVGGQYLKGASTVLMSGKGVEGRIVQFSVKYEPQRLRQLIRRRTEIPMTMEGKEGQELEKLRRQLEQVEKQIAVAELPEGLDLENNKQASQFYRGNAKEQFNPQLADRLRIDITIAPGAAPGVRELRIDTPAGLSNPIYFEVGTLKEVYETEPNDDHMEPGMEVLSLPCLMNGQILPGDIDHFRFKAAKGQSLVVDVGARRITPYLADAVPGWFQAVVALYDEEGNEVAYQDDYKFNPDPVLFFDVPAPGTYTLSIKDAIYRGREDFVYRIAIGELPFITGIFPLGVQSGQPVKIALSGKNLPKKRLGGIPSDGAGEIRHVSVAKDGYRSNRMPFAIGDAPDVLEQKPNNTRDEAQPIEMPSVVNGRIDPVGDTDVFSFQGTEGQTMAMEVMARRLHSPLDSVMELTGPGIETPVRCDDYVSKDAHLHLGSGLLTHHADSYLLYTLPATGTYHLRLSDAQSKGGSDHAYRLRIGPARPGFELSMQPSGMHIGPGGTAAFTVRVHRLDGFTGEIELNADKLPAGYSATSASIPAGAATTRLTITAPKEMGGREVRPTIMGTALVGDQTVECFAVPVDDQMQAFLYRHLVPARELVLAPGGQPAPLIFKVRLPRSKVVELPLGQDVRLGVDGTIRPGLNGAGLQVDSPPDGIDVVKGWVGRKRAKNRVANGGSEFIKGVAAGQITLKATAPLKPGDEFSLVVEAVVKRGREETRYPAPAIAVRIVDPVSE